MSNILTTSGVAVRYALSESRVRQLADAGVIPHERDNTGKRIFQAELVARALSPQRTRKTTSPR